MRRSRTPTVLIEEACLAFPHDQQASFDRFEEHLLKAIREAMADPEAVGFKSVICYRTGLAIPRHPDAGDARSVFAGIHKQRHTPGAENFKRLDHAGLNEYVVHQLCQTITEDNHNWKKPIQFHTGLGDNGIPLTKSSASHMQEIIRAYPGSLRPPAGRLPLDKGAEKDGSPVAFCARTALIKALDAAKKLGLTFTLGFEIEFVLMKRGEKGEFEPLDNDGHAWSAGRAMDHEAATTVVEKTVLALDAGVAGPRGRGHAPLRERRAFLPRHGDGLQNDAAPEALRHGVRHGVPRPHLRRRGQGQRPGHLRAILRRDPEAPPGHLRLHVQ
ncbi:unnamed protein product, partial [Clonostachys rosea f. rosea IK726]